MRVAIIDDRIDDRMVLFRELDTVLREKGYAVDDISLFASGEEFLAQFEKGKYDLIFFDIYMEGISGIEAASRVRETDRTVRVVFVTTSNDFAAESYSLRADYYLLKPFVHEDIVKAIEIINLEDYERQRVITLPDDSTCLLHDILYSEYYNHRIVLHLKNFKKKVVRTSQARMESLLCDNHSFVTCTKGMIVNLEYVRRIEEGTIYLEEDRQVPVSRRRMPEIRKAHAAYLFRQVRQ
ncbi:MAG: LytTR family DNA-binding domain-containing protein [Eubacteriales bacterium]|nr:LytTR family DNA-binding domain-containing protein [Eubacteriales bacterium]